VAAGDAAPQRAALADEMFLPDKLLEVPWAHSRCERLALGRWLEQGFRTGAGNAAAWHMVILAGSLESAGSINTPPHPCGYGTSRRYRRRNTLRTTAF
jgi:hypothetical protein